MKRIPKLTMACKASQILNYNMVLQALHIFPKIILACVITNLQYVGSALVSECRTSENLPHWMWNAELFHIACFYQCSLYNGKDYPSVNPSSQATELLHSWEVQVEEETSGLGWDIHHKSRSKLQSEATPRVKSGAGETKDFSEFWIAMDGRPVAELLHNERDWIKLNPHFSSLSNWPGCNTAIPISSR